MEVELSLLLLNGNTKHVCIKVSEQFKLLDNDRKVEEIFTYRYFHDKRRDVVYYSDKIISFQIIKEEDFKF